MKVPASEAVSATRRLRNVATRKGCQRLDVCLGFGLTALNSFLLPQNKAGCQHTDCATWAPKPSFYFCSAAGRVISRQPQIQFPWLHGGSHARYGRQRRSIRPAERGGA